MEVKHFLKPDWRKIMVFIIFLFFTPIPNFWHTLTCPECVTPWCLKTLENGTTINSTICPLGTPLSQGDTQWLLVVFYDSHFPPRIFIENLKDNPYVFILIAIISYTLSCLIVWIYDKFRKKKK